MRERMWGQLWRQRAPAWQRGGRGGGRHTDAAAADGSVSGRATNGCVRPSARAATHQKRPRCGPPPRSQRVVSGQRRGVARKEPAEGATRCGRQEKEETRAGATRSNGKPPAAGGQAGGGAKQAKRRKSREGATQASERRPAGARRRRGARLARGAPAGGRAAARGHADHSQVGGRKRVGRPCRPPRLQQCGSLPAGRPAQRQACRRRPRHGRRQPSIARHAFQKERAARVTRIPRRGAAGEVAEPSKQARHQWPIPLDPAAAVGAGGAGARAARSRRAEALTSVSHDSRCSTSLVAYVASACRSR